MARWPVTRRAVEANGDLARLRVEASTAGWLLPGAGWWPRPRCVGASLATAAWSVRHCPGCGLHVASLTATGPLEPGAEITVTFNPAPSWEAAAWPYEATFDGGARWIGERWVAGAGTTLPVRIATTVAAIPGGATA